MKPETSQELRGLVREVLKEAMANRAPPKQGVETIRIGSDADLQAFVSRLCSPGIIESVRAGKLGFTLGQTASAPTSPGDILEGVISEQKISALATKGNLILGPTAVLTPLARDRARKLGLKIERRR
ncbi:MAG: hypothetical protein Q8L53_13575 [Aestuariivirga sp.]|nr:hypothetical protein [Aestuariivirga sp.]